MQCEYEYIVFLKMCQYKNSKFQKKIKKIHFSSFFTFLCLTIIIENMANENFDELVSGISSNERKELLNSIQRKTGEINSSIYINQDLASQQPQETLQDKMNHLSFFQKIFLWFISLVKGTDVETVYNQYLLNKTGAYIESQYPGLLDHKKGLLLNEFYEKLVQLKNALTFFVQYTSDYEDNRSKFFVYLGTIIMPEVADEIQEKSDPFQYSFSKELNNEMRASLLAKLEDVENRIPQEKRNEMYMCVKSVEWLVAAIKQPVNRLLLKFVSNENGSKECPINQASTELIALAKFFTDSNFVPAEVIRSLFLFSQEQNRNERWEESVDAADEAFNKYITTADAQSSIIKMFAKSVPCAEIGKLATNDALFIPAVFGGGEDWLVQYKAEQKIIFERKWNSWLIEYKKEKVKHKLSEYFSIMTFPKFPVRPWSIYSDDIKFGYEYTLGFIYSFMKNYLCPYLPTLKTLSIEGDFSIKENRLELIETYGGYEKLNASLDKLLSSLNPNGEFALIFENINAKDCDNRTRIESVKEVLIELEKMTQEIIANFGKVARSMTNLLSTALGERASQFYGPVTNLNKIAGMGNKEFRENLYSVKSNIEHSFMMLSEMEALDIDNKK